VSFTILNQDGLLNLKKRIHNILNKDKSKEIKDNEYENKKSETDEEYDKYVNKSKDNLLN
jgi:hypothetical protein